MHMLRSASGGLLRRLAVRGRRVINTKLTTNMMMGGKEGMI